MFPKLPDKSKSECKIELFDRPPALVEVCFSASHSGLQQRFLMNSEVSKYNFSIILVSGAEHRPNILNNHNKYLGL